MSLTSNTGEREQLAYIAAKAADSRVNVEIETEGMTLNMGPQHPATHGTLRLVARLDGEQVVEAEPIMGYMHRGYEKLTEVRTYPQVTTLVNRIDWLGSFANEVPFILAAEQLMEIEAPPRAVHIRTILFELSRIANIALFLGDMGVQLGAVTPVFPGANWHEREAAEMFGIAFDEHPDMRNIYLPGDFEGHPLRKDYPLLSRRLKPWPGIVDVEPMPGDN